MLAITWYLTFEFLIINIQDNGQNIVGECTVFNEKRVWHLILPKLSATLKSTGYDFIHNIVNYLLILFFEYLIINIPDNGQNEVATYLISPKNEFEAFQCPN